MELEIPSDTANEHRPVPPPAPSVHRRALITWLAIFPLVTLAQIGLAPLLGGLPIVLGTAVLTAVVVPVAVYLVLPMLLRLNARLSARATGGR